jgi:hypothetical protein
MKLSIIQLSLLTIFISGLVPIPGLSHSLDRTETTTYPDSSLLAQVASYRPFVDTANQEEQLAAQASAKFITAFGQLRNTNDNARAIRLTNVLIETSTQAANHLERSSEFGLKSLPYYAGDPLAQTALDTTYRLLLEISQNFRGYGQIAKQARNAFRANDVSKLQLLSTKFQMLNEQRAQLLQVQQQISQAYINRSNAANAQLINNFSRQMGNGIIQRGQATKCMVSNLPYGSPAQVANNASGYCNSP